MELCQRNLGAFELVFKRLLDAVSLLPVRVLDYPSDRNAVLCDPGALPGCPVVLCEFKGIVLGPEHSIDPVKDVGESIVVGYD